MTSEDVYKEAVYYASRRLTMPTDGEIQEALRRARGYGPSELRSIIRERGNHGAFKMTTRAVDDLLHATFRAIESRVRAECSQEIERLRKAFFDATLSTDRQRTHAEKAEAERDLYRRQYTELWTQFHTPGYQCTESDGDMIRRHAAERAKEGTQ